MAFLTLIRPPTVASRHSYSIPVTPPLGLAYIAAALREEEHRVQFIDALAEDLAQIRPSVHPELVYQGLSIEQVIARVDPATEAIGLSSMFSLEWPHLKALVAALGKAFPGVPIILGGEHPTATYEYILRTCPAVTCVALGEGDQTIQDFAKVLDGKLKLDEVASIAFRDSEGKVVRSAGRPRVRDVDSLPSPAWDLVPVRTYLDGGYGYGVDLGRSMPVLATRGCPYQCTFCSSPQMWTTRYVMRAPDRVLDEIERYQREYGATNIDFYDLTAIVRRDWILEFCRGIERRGLKFTWQLPSGTRSEALDREVLGQLAKTGCTNLTYAPESGSPETLKRIKKKVTLEKIRDSMREAKRAGINVKCNLIIGFPDETRGDVYRTMLFMWRMALLGVDDSPLFLFSPYPGSELFALLKERRRIAEMDDDYFASLACYMDMGVVSRYCERIGPWELNLYRSIGMGVFYAMTYLSRPARIFRTIRNLLNSKSETVIEQRLLDMMKRRAAVAG